MKKNLLLFLIGATAFASTGSIDLGFSPEFTVDSAKNVNSKYTLPYSFKVNFEEQGISFGAKDGKYNKDVEIGKIDLLKNNVNLWGQYDIKGDGTHSGMLKVENNVSTDMVQLGTIATTLSGQYKYVSDLLTYTGTVKYKGDRVVLSPNYLALENKFVVMKDYTINLNIKEEFNGKLPVFDKSGTVFGGVKESKVGLVTVLDLNASINAMGATIEPGYKVSIFNGTGYVSTLDNDTTAVDTTNNSTYLRNDMKFDISYDKDFGIINLETALNNSMNFALLNGSIVKYSTSDTAQANQDYSVFNWTINPTITVSKTFNLKPIDVKVKLGLEDELTLKFGQKYDLAATKYESAIMVSNTLNIKPGVSFSTTIVEGLKLSTGVDFNVELNNASFNTFNTKFNAGLNYSW